MYNFSDTIPTNRQEELKNKILQNFEAKINPKKYAFWEIRNSDFTATFYNSSKFVIQGRGTKKLMAALGLSLETANNPDGYEIITVPHIGTDESGKGDFFGPLVIAGVYVNDEIRKYFHNLLIKDSKTLKDHRIKRLALEIQKSTCFSVVSISNKKYNELYNRFNNLNRLLAWGHATVIENILEKTACEMAVSDKFGSDGLIINALKTRGQKITLEQRVRGESDIAVAAASVLARATFIKKLEDMQNFYGLEFSKGCNQSVIAQANAFIKKYGKNRLNEVCKTHFKTFNEIL
ncbi:ribonuclease HIII [bacterium]|nr:ribonuclease HIII [bacterium]